MAMLQKRLKFRLDSGIKLSAIAMIASLTSAGCQSLPSQPMPGQITSPAQLYAQKSPSLVLVQFTWQGELGSRSISVQGVIVNPTGLVLLPGAALDDRLPDEQLKDFKILLPQSGAEPLEFPAAFQGRDERYRCAYVKPLTSQHWPAIQFVDKEISPGDVVWGLSLMGGSAGYRPLVSQAMVASVVNQDTTQVTVSNNLTKLGSPIFNQTGDAIGLVLFEPQPPVVPSSTSNASGQARVIYAPQDLRFFLPTSAFELSLLDPPAPEKPVVLSWTGMADIHSISVAEMKYFGLKDPAVQVGGIISDTPAERAGLKPGQMILKLDGKPLERGDNPELIPARLQRYLAAKPPGESVTFTILDGKGASPRDITFKLEPMPKLPRSVARSWQEDLGFGTRSLTLFDTHAQHLPRETPGVITTVVKPDGASAAAGLKAGDLVMQFNGATVNDLEQFKQSYEQLRKDRPDSPVVLMIRRDGTQQTIKIEPGG